MIARYPGRCALTGAAIRPGDTVVWHAATRTVSLPSAPAPDPSDVLDSYMPRHGLGRSRAQVWRAATNARHAAHLDHEAE